MSPIRVLHVVTYMGRGGLETMIMNFYRHVDRSKVQFDFLVHRDFRADYDDEIESLGGKIYRLPRLVPWSRSYLKALNGFFEQHPEYRIVHVHQDCLSSVILKAAQRQGVPVRIAHSHNSSQDKNLKYPIKLYYRRLIPKYATDLYACSKQAGRWMFGNAAFSVVNNAIDAKNYSYSQAQAEKIRGELGIDRNTLVVGHVGRFAPTKNHAFLLEIFVEVCRRCPDAALLLVGDGELRASVEERALQMGIKEKVIFTGVRSDVPELIQAMDIFVFPSIYEGLPVTLIEAQAVGLPCVVSDAVTEECAVTSLVQRVPLKESAQHWAECILNSRDRHRSETYSYIAAAGYDIANNAVCLENEYMTKWKECN